MMALNGDVKHKVLAYFLFLNYKHLQYYILNYYNDGANSFAI